MVGKKAKLAAFKVLCRFAKRITDIMLDFLELRLSEGEDNKEGEEVAGGETDKTDKLVPKANETSDDDKERPQIYANLTLLRCDDVMKLAEADLEEWKSFLDKRHLYLVQKNTSKNNAWRTLWN